MQYFRVVASVVLASCVFPGPVRAQQNECRQRIIPVEVITRDGAPPPSLTAAHFEASYGEKPVRVTAVSGEHRPQRLVLLLDASGSVRGGTVAGWEATVQVGAQLLTDLPPMEIGLALFAEEVEVVLSPTTDRKRLLEEIDRLRAGPSESNGRRQRTALWDSLLDSAAMFGPFRAGDVVYVVTDGVDNHSETRPAAVTQVFASAGIRLFGFAIANEGFAYGSGDLERMVDDTGGSIVAGSARDWRAFRASQGISPIGNALQAQHRQMVAFHRLEVELAESITRPQIWKIGLTGLNENEAKNLVVSYPLRLFPCN